MTDRYCLPLECLRAVKKQQSGGAGDMGHEAEMLFIRLQGGARCLSFAGGGAGKGARGLSASPGLYRGGTSFLACDGNHARGRQVVVSTPYDVYEKR